MKKGADLVINVLEVEAKHDRSKVVGELRIEGRLDNRLMIGGVEFFSGTDIKLNIYCEISEIYKAMKSMQVEGAGGKRRIEITLI